MDACPQNPHHQRKIARFESTGKFLPVLSCIHIDSFFLHAIAFEKLSHRSFLHRLETRTVKTGTMKDLRADRFNSTDDWDFPVTRGQSHDPLMDHVFMGLRDDAPFARENIKYIESLSFSEPSPEASKVAEVSIGGISVTYPKDSPCLKGIAYPAEAT